MSAAEAQWVFAYGSNMDLGDLRSWLAAKGHRAGGIRCVQPAVLAGYRLIWNYRSISRDGGAANVGPCVGRDLPGLALSVDDATLAAIDPKEGHPRFYSRGSSPLAVRLQRGDDILAWVYVAVPERCSAVPVSPRRAYLELLRNAATEHALPAWDIAELEATAAAD
jgi:hypothetical protein